MFLNETRQGFGVGPGAYDVIIGASSSDIGDNSIAGEVWLLRNKLQPHLNAEEGASIRAVRRVFAERSGISMEEAPDPKDIYRIGCKMAPGNHEAAVEAFRQLGAVVGDAVAQAIAFVDGLVVIGGEISGAWPLFLPTLIKELNSSYAHPAGNHLLRRASIAFNLDEPAERATFLRGEVREITVPGTVIKVSYDSMQR